MAVKSTVDKPNPMDSTQAAPGAARDTGGVRRNASGWVDFPPANGRSEEQASHRDFRIGDRLIEEYGPTPGCQGCTRKVTGNGWDRTHNSACRKRFEEKMIQSEYNQGVLHRRDARKTKPAEVDCSEEQELADLSEERNDEQGQKNDKQDSEEGSQSEEDKDGPRHKRRRMGILTKRSDRRPRPRQTTEEEDIAPMHRMDRFRC